jgi:hypothetical protein
VKSGGTVVWAVGELPYPFGAQPESTRHLIPEGRNLHMLENRTTYVHRTVVQHHIFAILFVSFAFLQFFISSRSLLKH